MNQPTYYEQVREALVERLGEHVVEVLHVPRALESGCIDMFLQRESGKDVEFIREALLRLRAKGHLG